jgi:hypothetical protein
MATATPTKRATPVKPSENGSAALPYRFEVVPLKYLVVDKYQRPLSTFVDRIIRKFDPALVGTLCASERSKTKFALIDGQTRAKAMERLGMRDAPCIVYEGLTLEQEAELFSKFQTERRGMTSASRFKAQVIAGNEIATAINDIVEGLGFTIDHNSSEPGALRAVAALEYAYRGASGQRNSAAKRPELLATVLEVIRGAWPKVPDTAKSALMIRGLAFFLNTVEDVQQERLTTKLSKITPSDLAKRAEMLREGHGGMSGKSPAYLAEAIEAQYRKGR